MIEERIISWEELPPHIRDQWRKVAISLSLPPLTFGTLNNSSPQDRFAAINQDPALCAIILAVANSATLGRLTPIVCVEQAVHQLGQNMLQVIMSAYHMETVIGHFPAFSRHHFDFVRNWSALSAITAYHLASNFGLESRGIVSTAALIARLGSLALGLTWPAPDKRYYLISDENQRYYLEMEKWRISTPLMGQQIARHWGLPEPLPTLIQLQETPLFSKLENNEEGKNLLIMCVASTITAAYMLNPQDDPVEALYQDHYSQLKQNMENLGLADVLRLTWDSGSLNGEIKSFYVNA